MRPRKRKRSVGLRETQPLGIDVPPLPPPPTDPVLKVKGILSVDDYTPALYNMFATTYDDIWTRVTVRQDLHTLFGNIPLYVLGWTEWVNDQTYFGDWWRTGGIACYTEAFGSSGWPAGAPWNVSSGAEATGYRVTPTGGGSGLEVYDFRAQWFSDTIVGGNPKSRWYTEAWHNDTKKYDQVWLPNGDSHQRTFHSIQAIAIFNRYAESGDLYIDDISVGTSRGADDILPVQSFNDFTFGDFTVDPGETSGMVDSFAVIDALTL